MQFRPCGIFIAHVGSFVEHILSWAGACFTGRSVHYDRDKKVISVNTSIGEENIPVTISLGVKPGFEVDLTISECESLYNQLPNEEWHSKCESMVRDNKYELDRDGRLSRTFPPTGGISFTSQAEMRGCIDAHIRVFLNDRSILKDRIEMKLEESKPELKIEMKPENPKPKYELKEVYKSIKVKKMIFRGIYTGTFEGDEVSIYSLPRSCSTSSSCPFPQLADQTRILEAITSLTQDNDNDNDNGNVVKIIGWLGADIEQKQHSFVVSYSESNILILSEYKNHKSDINLVDWWGNLRQSKIFREYYAVVAILDLAKFLGRVIDLRIPFAPISLDHVIVRKGGEGYHITLNAAALCQSLFTSHSVGMTETACSLPEGADLNLIARAFGILSLPVRPRFPREIKQAPPTLLSWFGLIIALIFFIDVESEDEGSSREASECSLDECASDPPCHLTNPVANGMKNIVANCMTQKTSTISAQIAILESLLLTLRTKATELRVSDFDVGLENPEFKVEEIGFGGFAIVHKAHHNQERKWLALKQLKDISTNNIKAFQHEIMLLCQLQGHLNVVKLYGVMKRRLVSTQQNNSNAVVFEDSDSEHHVVIVSEYCSAGNLRHFINKCVANRQAENFNYVVSELPIMVDILLGVSDGMKFLHAQNIFHRDLKPENVLLENDGDGKLVAKVGDLGISLTLENHQLHASDSTMSSVGTVVDFRGSLPYLAPEVFLQKKCNFLTDVYSFAILMHDCLVTSHFGRKFIYENDGTAPAGLNLSSENLQLYYFVDGVKNNTVHPKLDDVQGSCFHLIPSEQRKVLQCVMEQSWSYERKKRPDFSSIYDQLSCLWKLG